MKKLLTGLSIILFLIILAYVLAFAVHNSDSLALDFLVGQPVEWPIAVWLGVTFFVGALIGLASGLVLRTKQKLHIHRLTKELAKQSKQNARVESIK